MVFHPIRPNNRYSSNAYRKKARQCRNIFFEDYAYVMFNHPTDSNHTNNTWIVVDLDWHDDTWLLEDFVYEGLNLTDEGDTIGYTPEGHEILYNGDCDFVVVAINHTVNATEETYYINYSCYKSGSTDGMNYSIHPNQTFAINNQETYGWLSPVTNDTDGDDVLDKVEYIDGYAAKNLWNESISVKTNATLYDTDGDGIGDGQEVDGWNVTIAWYNSTGGLETKEIQYYTDPTVDERPFMDSDEDGISDYDEIYPEENPIFSWFFNMPNHNKSAQFNPYIKENSPPIVRNMTVSTRCHTWNGIPTDYYTRVKLEVYDVGLISELKIWVVETSSTRTWRNVTSGWYQTHLDITAWNAANRYNVKVHTIDYANNNITMSQEKTGLIGDVLDFLGDIWTAIMGGITKAWEEIKKAVDWIINWIIEKILSLINRVLEPIKTAVNAWMKNLVMIFDNAWAEFNTSGKLDKNTHNDIQNILFGNFFYLMVAMGIVFMAIGLIISPFVSVFSFLISMIISLLMPIIMKALCSEMLVEKNTGLTNGKTLAQLIDFVKSYLNISTPTTDFAVDILQVFLSSTSLGIAIWLATHEVGIAAPLAFALACGQILITIEYDAFSGVDVNTTKSAIKASAFFSGVGMLCGFATIIGSAKMPAGGLAVGVFLLGIATTCLCGYSLWKADQRLKEVG